MRTGPGVNFYSQFFYTLEMNLNHVYLFFEMNQRVGFFTDPMAMGECNIDDLYPKIVSFPNV